LAPKEADNRSIDSAELYGGNIDIGGIGKGATMYYPVCGRRRPVVGWRLARFAGRFRAVRLRQSNARLNGTFQIILHKKADLVGTLSKPSISRSGTKDEWLVHGFSLPIILTRLGDKAQSDITRNRRLTLRARCVPQDAQIFDDDQELTGR